MAMEQEDLPTFGLGDRLRKAREHRGYTQIYMADQLTARGRPTAHTSISGWEAGKDFRKFEWTVALWAEITDFPRDWFFRQSSLYLTPVDMPDGQLELALGDHTPRVRGL